MKEKVNAIRLRELFSYCPESGTFARRKSGKCVGYKKNNGYIAFTVDSTKYFSHRLAWLYVHGVWPSADIDHIDGDRSNNKIANLRDVTRSTNLQNMRAAKSNNKSTGLLGSYLIKQTGRYTSRIQVNKADVYLGVFDTAEDAHIAYMQAKKRFHIGSTL